MDTPTLYGRASAIWLALKALPLLFLPKLLATLRYDEPRAVTDYEIQLSRSLAFTELAFAAFIHLFLGTVLPGTSESANTRPAQPGPYVQAGILITTLYHTCTAIHGYLAYLSAGSATSMLGLLGNVLLAVSGLWCLLFAGGKHISRRTGSDKRTSGFPFKNAEAQRRKS